MCKWIVTSSTHVYHAHVSYVHLMRERLPTACFVQLYNSHVNYVHALIINNHNFTNWSGVSQALLMELRLFTLSTFQLPLCTCCGSV